MIRAIALVIPCSLLALACGPELVESASDGQDDTDSSEATGETHAEGDAEASGDGDADSGDGDGDTGDGDTDTGDGDGDTGDGDGDTGDGDGDTGDGDGDTGDGDGDGDGDTGDGDGDGDGDLGLPSIDCSEEADLQSENSDAATTITWINVSGEIRKTHWLNYQGDRVLYTTLDPGGMADQGTFAGHPWLITDADDNCIEIYMPEEEPAEAYLD